MNSNDHPGAYGYKPPRRLYDRPLFASKPQVNEDTLKQRSVQIERKTFVFSLKENVRGRLLRITEDLNGRRNSIIVPSTGLVEFKEMLEEMLVAAKKLPPAPTAPQHSSVG